MRNIVCSNRPRPRTQTTGHYFMKTGDAEWGKDPFHVMADGPGAIRTLCGRDASEWLKMNEPMSDEAIKANGDACSNCVRRLP